jgi:hypothetical protein
MARRSGAPPSTGPRSLEWAVNVKSRLEAAFDERAAPILVLETGAARFPEDRFLHSLMDTPLRDLGRLMATQEPDIVEFAANALPFARPASDIAAHGDEGSVTNVSVGYTPQEDGAFGIEIRLQNPTISAVLQVKEMAARYGADAASIGIVRQLMTHAGPPVSAPGTPSLTLGCSVGVAGGPSGTLGGFVRDAQGQAGILSCSHVLARGGVVKRGEPVFHPSVNDDPLANQRIAKLEQFEDMLKPGPRPWDAASAVLEPAVKCGANRIPMGRHFPNEGRRFGAEIRAPLTARTVVAKIGRTTGWTSGVVTAENLGPLSIWFPGLNRNLTVSGMTEITWNGDGAFSGAGDSGSLAYVAGSVEPLGLVVAGGLRTVDGVEIGMSYLCPLAPILDQWKLTLL